MWFNSWNVFADSEEDFGCASQVDFRYDDS